MASQFLESPRHQLQVEDWSVARTSVGLDRALRKLRYELDLPAEARQRPILERFRSWLEAPEESETTISEFVKARELLEPEELECLDECEESAALDGLSYYEFRLLVSQVPWLRRLDPRAWQPNVRPTAPELFGALTWAMEAHAEGA